MKKLIISFTLSMLISQGAFALVEESMADHAVNLLEVFKADNVDSVVNESVNKLRCQSGIGLITENEAPTVASRGPALAGGKSVFKRFQEDVKSNRFRENYYKEGDVYSYGTQTEKIINFHSGIGIQNVEYEHVFNRKSKGVDSPFEHELGITKDQVKKALLDLIVNSDEHYQVTESAFSVRVNEKAYLIDLSLPLLANPVYKQDVKTGQFDYGLTNVVPRIYNADNSFLSSK